MWLSGLFTFGDFLSWNKVLRLPAWSETNEFLLCSLHSIKIRLRRWAEAPEVANFHIAITIGELHRHLRADGIHLRCESSVSGSGNALHIVAINKLSTARTDRVPVFECRGVSWVPALKTRAWPNTIFPLGTRDNTKSAIVIFSIQASETILSFYFEPIDFLGDKNGLALLGRRCRLHPGTDFQEDDVMPLALSKPPLTASASPPF